MPLLHKVTLYGLFKWNKHLYENLGWMHLANTYGNTDKVRLYKKSIDKLIEAIIEKEKNTTNVDKINDLKILLEHAKYLKKFASQI